AIEDYASLSDNVEQIVIMGGALNVPGNVFDSPAEWNIYIDASSAKTVIESGIPITLVPLDATNHVPVPPWYPAALEQAGQSEAIGYLDRMVTIFPSVTSGFYYFWDELAAAVVAQTVKIDVEETSIAVMIEGAERGRTALDTRGSLVTAVVGVANPDAFYEEFISTLAGAPFAVGGATPEEEAYLVAAANSLSDVEAAFNESFSNPNFNPGGAYISDLVADIVDRLMDGWATSLAVLETLDPPASLVELHNAHAEEMREVLAIRTEVVEGLRAASSWEEASVYFGRLGDGRACVALGGAAGLLGVEVYFACNP
ncbi:MAG: nucleoside hydrolase, partial [Acidimicrobiia bacterium]